MQCYISRCSFSFYFYLTSSLNQSVAAVWPIFPLASYRKFKRWLLTVETTFQFRTIYDLTEIGVEEIQGRRVCAVDSDYCWKPVNISINRSPRLCTGDDALCLQFSSSKNMRFFNFRSIALTFHIDNCTNGFYYPVDSSKYNCSFFFKC